MRRHPLCHVRESGDPGPGLPGFGKDLLAFAAVLAMLAPAFAADDLSVDAALERAGAGLAAAAAWERLDQGRIAFAAFVDVAGVACEPLATMVRNGVGRSLVQQLQRQGRATKVVEIGDPGQVDAAVSATWMKGAGDQVRLTVKLGEIKSMAFANLGIEEVAFAAASLPAEARDCLLQYRPVEREVAVKTPLVVRSSPSPLGQQIARLDPGDVVWVAARVAGKDREKWSVVRLKDDDAMPVGMRERKGFVYELPVPIDPDRDFEIAELDAMAVATGAANLRAYPLATAKVLGELPAWEGMQITGKVAGKPWFRVTWKEGEAFVHEGSVRQVDPAEYAAWQKARPAKDAAPLAAFLAAWPEGVFADMAKKRLEAIRPSLKVEAWVDKGTFRRGERVRIHLKGSADFYAALFYKDAEGNMVQLLPNAWRSNAFFKGGVEHVVPSSGDRFDLEIRPPFGNETIYVFASTDVLPRIPGKTVSEGLTLVGPDMQKIRGAMRGIGAVAKPASGQPAATQAPSVEASVSLRTVP